jgi:hypothetical protein
MQLFVCILKSYPKLEELMLTFIERGLPGCTLLDGRGLRQIMRQDMPIFAQFIAQNAEAESGSYLLLFVGTEAQVSLCFELSGALCAEQRGLCFSVPLARVERFGGGREG